MDIASLNMSDALLERLSHDRQKKVLAYKHAGSRNQSLGAGLLLDYALQQHGLSEKNITYKYGPHGKPYINDTIHFNLSHSGTMVACAIATTPVGIDIERTSRRISEALIHRVCSVSEQELVHRDPATFFDLWTAKEAYVKMTGEGISSDMTSIDITNVTTWRLPEGYALSCIIKGSKDNKITFLRVSLAECTA